VAWQDTTSTVTPYLAAPPALDPEPSPQVGPRSIVATHSHAWSDSSPVAALHSRDRLSRVVATA
jgi:hypothetical protein